MSRGTPAGPAGSGLIPPIAGGNQSPPNGGAPPPPDDNDQHDSLDEDLIDSPPPPDDDDDDDDHDDDGDGSDRESPEEMEERITRAVEERLQKRFDRAISKTRRRLEEQYRSADDSGDDDDDDDDGGEHPPPRTRRRSDRSSRRSDVTSIRMLARDRLSDEMERSGSAERTAVKKVIDTVIPYVDWRSVDQDDVIDELVESLSGTASDLIRIGSERKVRQLRTMGALPPASSQPGGAQRGGQRDTAAQMQRGKSLAEQRYPDGKRRLGGRR
jgi:hypothetical protein